MRRRIAQLADEIDEAISEDDHDALLIRGDGPSMGLVQGALATLEARESIDLFVRSFEPFTSAEACAVTVIGRVTELLGSVGLAPLPAFEPHRSPEARLQVALAHLGREGRSRGDVRVALVLCPMGLTDEAELAAFALTLARAARPTRFKLFVRDVGGLGEALREAAVPTLSTVVDLSRRAVRDALAEEALDETNDPRARASAALTVAMGDAAEGRFAEALSALATLADHHHARGEHGSRATAFVLAGFVLARAGELDEGRRRLAQGIELAIEAKDAAAVVTGAMGAGSLAMLAAAPSDAVAHYDLAARTYAQLGLAGGVAQALVERGRAQLVLEQWAEARNAWLAAAEAANRGRAPVLQRTALELLADLYRRAQMPAERDAIEAQLRRVSEPPIHPHAHVHGGDR